MLQNNLRALGTVFRSVNSYVPARNITIRTTQAATVGVRTKTQQFSRQMLEDIITKPSAEEIRQMAEIQREKDLVQSLYENKHNDRNPNNFLKVKINLFNQYNPQNATNTLANTQTQIDQLKQKLSRPVILLKQPRNPKITISGIRRKVPCGLKKLFPFMKLIAGKHVFDAINAVANSPTKAAKFVGLALQQVRRHAQTLELCDERLYVSKAILGKHQRWRRLRYMAKGRASNMLRDSSQLFIELEERPIETIYKDMMMGKFPMMLAYLMRKQLLDKDADYETIRKYASILTSKGRQQRKLMLKRQVIYEQLAFKVRKY